MLKNYWKHFCTVNKHRWLVFKLCCRAGIPWRGLVHDLSKYTPTEFIESARHYQGVKSPIPVTKQEEGYSKAWLHHKGRNKHHVEYWHDPTAPNSLPIIPYKYIVETICDCVAASKTYNGKNWTTKKQLDYWEKNKYNMPMNEKIRNLLTEVFMQMDKENVNKIINKNHLKKLYKEYCE